MPANANTRAVPAVPQSEITASTVIPSTTDAVAAVKSGAVISAAILPAITEKQSNFHLANMTYKRLKFKILFCYFLLFFEYLKIYKISFLTLYIIM